MEIQNAKDFDRPTYLFHADHPKGRMFNADQVEEMLEKGWVDSPARLKLPENDDIDLGVSKADLEKATAPDIVKACEAMGFIVLTPEQLQAEANKMASVVAEGIDITGFTDEAVIEEFERRFGSETGSVSEEDKEDFVETLKARFDESPESLNKDELVALGNNAFDLGLRSNFKPETMIERIKVAMSEE